MTKTQIQEIKPLVEEIVENKLRELLGDPDRELEFKDSIRQRLQKSLHSKTKTIPAEKVTKKLGLHW